MDGEAGEFRFPAKIGLGTWPMGEDPALFKADAAAVTHALEVGYRVIDTAEKYANGGAERVVGEALKIFGAGRRAETFIVSKVMAENATTAERVIAACEASISRMNCDYLDLYLLHWPDDRQREFANTLRGFDKLRSRGLIRYFGVSNFSERELEIWLATQSSLGIGGATVCNQVPYSAGVRWIENGLLDWQRLRKIQTMAYSPLQTGGLTGNPTLTRLGKARGLSAAQIALAWCVRHPDVMAIVKSTNRHRLEENLRASEVHLTENEIQQIDQAFPVRLKWLRALVRPAHRRLRRLFS
jgi:diketogulonate reductase-like aldo/keto reductase